MIRTGHNLHHLKEWDGRRRYHEQNRTLWCPHRPFCPCSRIFVSVDLIQQFSPRSDEAVGLPEPPTVANSPAKMLACPSEFGRWLKWIKSLFVMHIRILNHSSKISIEVHQLVPLSIHIPTRLVSTKTSIPIEHVLVETSAMRGVDLYLI